MSLCHVIATAERPKYAAITVPLLIIAGAEDMTANMAGCEAILDQYSTRKEEKSIKIISGVGHWHCIEAGDVVAGHIKDFILGDSALISK
jgi:pimeloyl-ACP methyl ester carboxylesterase